MNTIPNKDNHEITNNIFTMHPITVRNFLLKKDLIAKGYIVKEVGENGIIEYLLVTADINEHLLQEK